MEPVLGSSGHWPDSDTFWRNQRVVVTGGAGFLGSFVVEKLQACGAAEIFVLRIEDYDPSTALPTPVGQGLPLVAGQALRQAQDRLPAAADSVAVVTDHAWYDWATIRRRVGLLVDT